MKKPTNPPKVGKLTCRFYLADDVRSELNGKVTLVGLYPDDTIVFEMPAGIPDPTPEVPIGSEGITILCTLFGFTGSAVFDLALRGNEPGSTGQTHQASLHVEKDAAHVNMISKFRPLLVQSFGVKTFTISCAELDFYEEYKFQLKRRTIQEIKLTAPEPQPTIKKRVGSKRAHAPAPIAAKKGAKK